MHWKCGAAVTLSRTCLLAMTIIAGCTESENAVPKKDLTDKDKEQIRQLNEQRASEWSSTKRK